MKISRADHSLSIATPDGPLPIRQVLAIGRNYAEHAHEQGADIPDRPVVFTKWLNSLALDGDTVTIPPICEDPATGGGPHGDEPRSTGQVDWEAELAVVIGKAARDVEERDALDHVLGYACANDVSARWWQKNGGGGQWNRGKSFDGFCPIGPEVVPAASIADPQRLAISCRVNGETMQDANTDQMIFPVRTLISELSRGLTLIPGTVILTGTPSGVGVFRDPRLYLQGGDVVEVEIEGIGVLRNTVA